MLIIMKWTQMALVLDTDKRVVVFRKTFTIIFSMIHRADIDLNYVFLWSITCIALESRPSK